VVREPLFHYEAIDHLVQQLVAHDTAWQQYFDEYDIHPFIAVYEEWTSTYEATALNILQYLHIPIPKNLVIAEPPMQRQADALSEEWVQQYQAQKREREEKIHAE
jgi:LPS sulfotransferase NodH